MCQLSTHLTGALNCDCTCPSLFCSRIVRGTKLPQHSAKAPAVLRNFPIGCLEARCLGLVYRDLHLVPSFLHAKVLSELYSLHTLTSQAEIEVSGGKDMQRHSPPACQQ